MDLSELLQLQTGDKCELAALPFAPYAMAALPPAEAKSLSSSSRSALPTLTTSLTLEAPSLTYNISGHLWKYSGRMYLSNAFKRRYFVLCQGRLFYSDDELSLQSTKHVVDCSSITDISFTGGAVAGAGGGGKHTTTPGAADDAPVLKITFRSSPPSSSSSATDAEKDKEEHWLLQWDAEMSQNVREKWMLLLHRNCHLIDDPLLQQLGVPRSVKVEMQSSALATAAVGKPKKRMSLLS